MTILSFQVELAEIAKGVSTERPTMDGLTKALLKIKVTDIYHVRLVSFHQLMVLVMVMVLAYNSMTY